MARRASLGRNTIAIGVLSTVRSPSTMTFLLGLLLGVILGFAIRGFVHHCPPPLVGPPVELHIQAGPVSEQPSQE